MLKQSTLSCLGAGAFGLTVAAIEAKAGKDVLCWTRDPTKVESINRGENPHWEKLQLPTGVRATTSFDEAIEHSDMLLFAIPAKGAQVFASGHSIPEPKTIVSLSKAAIYGRDPSEFRTTTELLGETWGENHTFAALAGPNLAHELARGGWAASLLASRSIEDASRMAAYLATDRLAVYATDQLDLMEVVSICKTAYSIPMGLRHACAYQSEENLDYEAYLTGTLMDFSLREFREIAAHRAGLSKDSQQVAEISISLAGLGDFITSTFCVNIRDEGRDGLSGRNVKFGFDIGMGKNPEELLQSGADTLEGYTGLIALEAYSKKHSLRTPVLSMTMSVLRGEASPKHAFGTENMINLLKDHHDRHLAEMEAKYG